MIGTVLSGRYQILRLIGDGGMGRVYEAQHATLARKIAVKVLKEELARTESNVERFVQEARAASMITHPNVVDIIDVCRDPGGPVFIVMEFLQGEDLEAVLRRETRLSWERVQPIALQIVRGLRAAHEQGVIHRDMKPANLFLTRTESGDQVKILDFGIAKLLATQEVRGLTNEGSVFGTASYMSPEQASGRPVDARSDVYAVGVILYEMLTGRPPFDSDNFMRVASQHIREAIPPMRQAAPDARISEVVESLVMRALEKDPEQRYPSMREFEAAVLGASFEGTVALTNPLTADLPDRTIIYDVARGQARRSPAPRTSRGDSYGADDDVDKTLVRASPVRRSSLPHLTGVHQPPPLPALVPTSAALASSPGAATFLVPTPAPGQTPGGGYSAYAQPARQVPSPAAPPRETPAAYSPKAQATLPPINVAATNPSTFEGRARGEAAETAEFALQLPKRDFSRNWLVAVTAVFALLLVAGVITTYFVVLDDTPEVSQRVHPAVIAAQPRSVVVPPAPHKPAVPAVKPPVAPPAPVVATPTPRPAKPKPPRPSKNKSTNNGSRNPGPAKAELGERELNAGFRKARRAIAACGTKHGAIAGSRFKATFDVGGGRAEKVSIQRPHNGTPLGLCVATAIRTSARFAKARRPTSAVTRTITF